MATEAYAVVLAGGRTKGELASATGQPHRALLTAGGRTLLDLCLDAVAESTSVTRTAVVAPAECRDAVARRGEGFDWLPSGDTMLGNLLAGIEALGEGPDLVLAVAGDCPLMTGATLDRLLQAAIESGDALCYPIVERAVCQAAYPEGVRTYARLREGRFTGGNVMVVSRRLLLANRETVESAYAARKSPLKLASLLGWGFLLRLPFGRVGLSEVERRAARMLGFPVSAWITEDATIAVDVDKLSDLRLVESCLGGA